MNSSSADKTRVRVKICGVRTVSDAIAADDAGADWIGLNFAPKSLRRVDPSTAAQIVDALRTQGRHAQVAALFVDAELNEISQVLDLAKIKIVQLHGDEPKCLTAALLDAFPSIQVVKAFRVGAINDINLISDYVEGCRLLSVTGRSLSAVLADASVPGQAGGTGVTIANDLLGLLAQSKAKWPPLILAGGLKPSNVADRLKIVQPWMADVSSGVEGDPKGQPGVKSWDLVREFVTAVRSVVVDQ